MHPGVEFVPSLKPYDLRKRWLVDTPILATAIVARDDLSATSLRDIPAASRGGAWLDQMLEALSSGLEGQGVVLSDTASYAAEQAARWMRYRHEISRILAQLRRADLTWFLIEVNLVVGAPARAARPPHRGRLPGPLALTLDALHNLLITLEQCEDYGVVAMGTTLLDADRDASAAHRYRQLLHDLLPEREIDVRVAEAERIWARHRADQGRARRLILRGSDAAPTGRTGTCGSPRASANHRPNSRRRALNGARRSSSANPPRAVPSVA